MQDARFAGLEEERRWEHRVSLESGDFEVRKAENSNQRRTLIRRRNIPRRGCCPGEPKGRCRDHAWKKVLSSSSSSVRTGG